MSFPPGTEMFQFPGFALISLCIQPISTWFNLRLVSLFVLTLVKTPAPLTQRASPARGLVGPWPDRSGHAPTGPSKKAGGKQRFPERLRRSEDNKETAKGCQVGFPIRKSPDQSLFAAPRRLSQRTTSFIASYRLGIHQTPFSRLIRASERATVSGPLRAAHSRGLVHRPTGSPGNALPRRCACPRIPGLSSQEARALAHRLRNVLPRDVRAG